MGACHGEGECVYVGVGGSEDNFQVQSRLFLSNIWVSGTKHCYLQACWQMPFYPPSLTSLILLPNIFQPHLTSNLFTLQRSFYLVLPVKSLQNILCLQRAPGWPGETCRPLDPTRCWAEALPFSVGTWALSSFGVTERADFLLAKGLGLERGLSLLALWSPQKQFLRIVGFQAPLVQPCGQLCLACIGEHCIEGSFLHTKQ